MATSKQLAKKYEADCQYLHHLFSGYSASRDEARAAVEIFTHRNTEELKLICQAYRALYSCDLFHLLTRHNTTFARVAYLRASEPSNLDAEITREALFGTALNTDVLIEIICTRSSSELVSTKQAYQARYNSNLERDVSFKINALNSNKYNGGRVDTSMAMCDAKTLYEAIESGKYIDQRCIILVLSQRSTDQIKAILSSYKQLYGREFTKFLKKEKCGEFGQLLRGVIQCIQFPEKHFAKQLRKRLKAGDAREVLIRTVVTRSEIDVRNINRVFTAKTGWTLESVIRNEFSNSSSYNDKLYYSVGDFLVALLEQSC
ncbi:annexin D7-like isoform X2 [Ananas comosus]|uniref:Annexin D7-like isoform X2 n=1 Tax=Ananas comosus TaxID=4615 RepID=A0A6P5ENF8_ANACO|nr:annexin D7-like isoform X2 [Ananas comosus]